jgi:cell filamentation protein
MPMPTNSCEYAVASTLAAERLEGWRPADEHIRALHALARREVSFADYLATFRARHPPPLRRRRRFGRARPYYIPGTTLLRNNFGAMSAEMLADLEYVATAGRMVQWLCRTPTGLDGLDARVLHRHLFGDVYSWAGEYRTTELLRGDQGFVSRSAIAARMTELHDSAQSIVDAGTSLDNPRLAYELARLYSEYNQIHPFREGNGRTGAVLLHAVATACDRRLDFAGVTRTEWYAASADSMPLHRDGRASHRPFLFLLRQAVVSR